MRFCCRSTHSVQQLLAFFFQCVPLRGHLPLHAVQLVTAAMQVSDQVRRFARFGRQQ